MMLSTVFTVLLSASNVSDLGSSPSINRYENYLDTGYKNYLNGNVMYQLPESIDKNQELSLIVMMKDTYSVLDSYNKAKPDMSFTDYVSTEEAQKVRDEVADAIDYFDTILTRRRINYEIGISYDTVFSGFEIIAKASEYEKICDMLSDDAVIVIGNEYEVAETKLVENNVDVLDTGIFDTKNFGYNGAGTIVAVLDTGLDYYHNAFKDENFALHNNGNYALTKDDVAYLIENHNFTAEMLQSGLTASDVYISNKVPYAFDYADGDSDVYPLLSNHGTHVAGIIAGHAPEDNDFRGAAPGAQLAIMKIFSDVMATARSAWILDALEDCVALGVDVINMSIGTSCGFSTETDENTINSLVYEKIRDQGISLVVAASNDFNSTYGSEKNGNLGLTSNPDSATVGSPGSYLGALSVASIEGAKTPYLLYNNSIVYFTESTDKYSEEKKFVSELLASLGTSKKTVEVEYVTIPGVGYTADYKGLNVKGKIALVRRGDSTFEEKALTAYAAGAIGIIVYNNVSGDIKMNAGSVDDEAGKAFPVCSISQDDGEVLAKVRNGKITISVNQTSGPFMSDFSSWGPTPDLRIKPEITAHGGSILSAVPGNSYDRISGTSMATPNVAGATALLRQYVIESFGFNPDTDGVEINNTVNRLMMSTADIVINKNGTPYAVRKQGAGLANLTKSRDTDAYIITYDKDTGDAMDKSKIELGADPSKKGEYTLVFSIKNFGTKSLSYTVSTNVFTEGVSDTKTSHGDTTVTETSYILDGAKMTIKSVEGGKKSGDKVTVAAGEEAKVTLTITLSSKDKKYLDKSFENGMYVEGFVMLDAQSGAIDLNVPFLAFYGDWYQAPQLDLDYFATNKDELDDAIDMEDKTLPDAYATRPVGGTSDDYVSFLGSYYFIQKPGTTKIAADRKYIAISNQTDAVNSLRFVWAGLLRNAKTVKTTIVDDATGEVVFTAVDKGVRKSYSSGMSIYPANIDIEFSAIEQNLKNNTSYTVTVQTYLDDGSLDPNTDGVLREGNTFTFPLVTDFEAPTMTDCEFYTEYDRSAKKTRLYAKFAIYDNHYSMALQPGYIKANEAGEHVFHAFERYMTPIYSTVNNTTYVTYELTDYLEEIKTASKVDETGALSYTNSITVVAYDYAINTATYEIELPKDYTALYFEETDITLSPNEVFDINPIIYPDTELADFVTYTSSNRQVARVVLDNNGNTTNKLIALKEGKARITATYTPRGSDTPISRSFNVTVLGPNDKGYKKYSMPVAETFELTGYYTNKAFYQIASEDKDIGDTGNEMKFGGAYSLSMYPSESVTLRYKLIEYYPDLTEVVFESGNEKIVKVDQNGTVTAMSKGKASIIVRVLLDGQRKLSQTVDIEVKDPFVSSGPSLVNYYGSGDNNNGIVKFPSTIAITEIGQFAFSNYEYVAKDPSEIYPGDTDTMKPWYIGDNTIKEVWIPEGVERIGPYAFANLTALKKIYIPESLVTIDYGAFEKCSALQEIITYKTVNGKVVETCKGFGNVKFINQGAFQGCDLRGNNGVLEFKSAVAIANSAFAGNVNLEGVSLSKDLQSVGAYAFAANTSLKTLTIDAKIAKFGQYAFEGCANLDNVRINASVIPTGMFSRCTSLTNITLGPDVSVIGEYAFNSTKVSNFKIEAGNTVFKPGSHSYLTSGSTLLLVAPAFTGAIAESGAIKEIANGAFSGNTKIKSVYLPGVTKVGNYAFSECTSLESITLGSLTYIGDFAFENTAITALPDINFENLSYFGMYSFAVTNIESVNIPDGVKIPAGAFINCPKLSSVTIGDDAVIGAYAFAVDPSVFTMKPGFNYYETLSYKRGKTNVYYYNYTTPLTSLTIGKNANISAGAFLNAANLHEVTLGEGARIGTMAFYNCGTAITRDGDNFNMQDFIIDLSGVKYIGDAAFSGPVHMLFSEKTLTDANGNMQTSMEYVYDENGEPIYIFHTPVIRTADLTAVTHIGASAFEYNRHLTSVTLPESLDRIANNAFYRCESLVDINLDGVKRIGKEAFANTALASVDLSSAVEIGEYAFCYNAALTSVKLGAEGATIAEGAFAYCEALAALEGEENVVEIGDYAFALTAIPGVDLSSIEKLGTQAFYKDKYTSFTLVLGENIREIGDNPFAYCKISPFSSVEKVGSFNGVDYFDTTYTYDHNEYIKIIDGSIYKVVPNGTVLITWTGGISAQIPDGTVRIGAMAFAGSDLVKVTLPYSLRAIGHKAFYECMDLAYVAFLGYRAPILEEEYDELYFTSAEHLAATGKYYLQYTNGEGEYVYGLGIVPYYIWNVTSNPTNVFYGATFVDYIGLVGENNDKGFAEDHKLTIMRPVNGLGYDTFIMQQYFDVVIDASAVADETTLAAIEAISKVPAAKEIKLNSEHKALVAAARAAYDKVLTFEQRALVTNLNILTAAEKKLADLQFVQNSGGSSSNPDPIPTPDDDIVESKIDSKTVAIIIISVIAAALLGALAWVIVLLIKAKQPKTRVKLQFGGKPNDNK